MKSLLKSLAKRTPLYGAYQRAAHRARERRLLRQFEIWTDDDQKRAEFYGQFVTEGALVFDVGANLGNRAKVFSRLGAMVIAVEPQPLCAAFLAKVFRQDTNVRILPLALGASTGQAEMLISDAHTISSLSTDWVRAVQESGRFAQYQWDTRHVVEMDTLDNLIEKYGRPDFVKIDVEGFEDQVLAGLSSVVPALSMEFTPEYIDSTHRCIERLCAIGTTQFQLSIGESMEWRLDDWVGPDEIRAALARLPRSTFGDIYARMDASYNSAATPAGS